MTASIGNENLNEEKTADEYEDTIRRALSTLRELREYPGDISAFWAQLTSVFARAVGAERGVLFLDGVAQAAYTEAGLSRPGEEFGLRTESLRARAVVEGAASGRQADYGCVLAIALETLAGEDAAVLVLSRGTDHESWADQAQGFLQVFSDTPHLYERLKQGSGGPRILPGDAMTDVLEIQAVLNSHRRFLALVMALVNEICIRFHASRVSLGWLDGDYARLKAVSHMDRFEKDLELVRGVEAAMEECSDQDEEILWPRAEFVRSLAVTRQHEVFARKKGLESVLSLPVRVEEETVGVLTLERSEGKPFSEREIMVLQLVCSQTARRLSEREKEDRWLGARLMSELRELLKLSMGPEHTLIKASAVAVALMMLFLCLWPWPYKVPGTFTLKTNDSVFIPAPFDGYVSEVPFREGDRVGKGDIMLKLDQRELNLDEADALAGVEKFRNDVNVALSQSRLAEMRSSMAQAEQSEARLKIVRMKQAQSQIRAPFDGIIVESGLKEKVGKPIRKGEVLLRLARLEGMYAEVEIPEEEIEDIQKGAKGELSFASRPELRYPFVVERIHPAAELRKEKNVFVVRVDIENMPESWWRPGMTGVAKIRAGHRPPIWIMGHRAVDQLRLKYLWF